MTSAEFIQRARTYPSTLHSSAWIQWVGYQELLTETVDSYTGQLVAQNALFRHHVCIELYKDLHSTDHPLVQSVQKQEITYHQRIWCILDSIQLCSFMMFQLAHVEDVPLLWQAKQANYDTLLGLDIQLLVGAGVEETLHYLQQVSEGWAVEAASYIQQCQAGGDFEDLEEYQVTMDTY